MIPALLCLSLEHRYGGGVLNGVGKAEVKAGGFAGAKELFAFAVKDDVGLARLFAADFDIVPADARADAGAERFRNSFLGGETGSYKRCGVLVRQAVIEFATDENAQGKTFSEFFVGSTNSGDFDQVDAGAEDHCAG